ncbi:FtsJ-like methyltransferase [Hamiltosporidium magnivora]|uniref:FtsJ-like methyltransferase n=1 Tax=Hamiltosporidium magnivora TaxID=148818 RepID=A0A4Q9LE67_9MICR|nr:FtsJ-like methyltransferase [Hamiltosporidium magnivora]
MTLKSKEKRDYYYKLAKEQNYRARSAYKLLQIDQEINIIKKCKNILDLCAAPGSWSQVVLERRNNEETKVVAIDVLEMFPLDGAIMLKEDITSELCVQKIQNIMNGENFDLVLCDGASDSTGFHFKDEFVQNELLLSSLRLSLRTGKVGSSFLGKCFRSENFCKIIKIFYEFYEKVKLFKPISSRAASIECFIYGEGLKRVDNCSLSFNLFDFNLDFSEMQKYFLQIQACGTGPDPDISTNDNKAYKESKYKPIDPPYKPSIQIRRNNSNT